MTGRYSQLWTDRVMLPSEATRALGNIICACPFCGSTNVGLWLGPSFYVNCGDCGAEGPIAEGREHGDMAPHVAVTAWNHRPPKYQIG